jgi:ribosome maturation factor RimP
MTDRLETVRTEVEPVVAPLGLSVYDAVVSGGVVRLVLDRPGGVDVDTLEEASRRVGPCLDGIIPGSYTLEVSSPGLERTLRRPEHYAGAVDEMVTVKARGDDGAVERLRGSLVAVDEAGITLRTDTGEQRVRFDAIESARTVFEWQPAPKPGKGSKPGKHSGAKKEVAHR